MRTNIKNLVCFIFLLYNVSRCDACGPRLQDDTTVAPPFWCAITATITAHTTCATRVVEIITLPWSSGTLFRSIPKQKSQTITRISVEYQSSNASYIALPVKTTSQNESNPYYASLTVTPPQRNAQLIVRISYVITSGVLIFRECASPSPFRRSRIAPSKTLMLVKWSVGGLSSAKRIDDIGVEFQLLNSASANFVDSQILHSASFVPKVNAVKLQADGVHVRQRGDARNVDAWDVIFFMRFAKKGGDGICPVARKCEAERAWRKGRVGNGGRGRLIAGLIVGGVAGVVIIAGCVCAVRRRGRRAEARLEEDEKEKGENMRDAESGSVVYDGKWKEWTEAGGKREQDDGIQNENEGRREYFALDLYKKGRDT